jgi:lysophospholipid acyltransferase (LPLAT)-like uncharacterized protein
LRILRRIVKSIAFQAVLCWCAAQYIRLVWFSGRWITRGADDANARFGRGDPVIVATWHGRLLMAPFGWHHSDRTHILVSAHSDGQIISRALAHFDTRTITGSTRRGGAQALRQLHRVLRDGGAVGITPDGPRGPRMRVTPGIIQLARLTGAPIYPFVFSARPCRVFESWDRFMLPLPFARGLYLWGAPVFVDRHAGKEAMEAARRALEDSLNALTRQADDELGHRAIEPAPMPDASERFTVP